jgi:hypothetical protein
MSLKKGYNMLTSQEDRKVVERLILLEALDLLVRLTESIPVQLGHYLLNPDSHFFQYQKKTTQP